MWRMHPAPGPRCYFYKDRTSFITYAPPDAVPTKLTVDVAPARHRRVVRPRRLHQACVAEATLLVKLVASGACPAPVPRRPGISGKRTRDCTHRRQRAGQHQPGCILPIVWTGLYSSIAITSARVIEDLEADGARSSATGTAPLWPPTSCSTKGGAGRSSRPTGWLRRRWSPHCWRPVRST